MRPIVYVTRDIERALGMEPGSGYFIVSNDTPYGREIKQKSPENVLLLNNARGILDTYDLMLLPEVEELIEKNKASVLVFQNTQRIERLAKEKSWNLLNPSADLAKRVEEKISQIEWLGNNAKLLPPHKIHLVKEVCFDGTKFVLQFNHSHTGQGTYIIDSKEKLAELQSKFPDRECRVTDFIDGPVFTVNAVVGRLRIFVGSPSYQITGLKPFTDLPFSTIGNDWSLPTHIERNEIEGIAKLIGKKLKKDGWKGLFGIDVIKNSLTGKMYLLEINARQPASAVFESKLQSGKNIFQSHIDALQNRLSFSDISKIRDGAQIVKRLTNKKYVLDIASLEAKNLTVMKYENEIYNKELFRIQSTKGIMESHNVFNELGNFIKSCLQL
jgi:predicted ATP-grasp superfamily ATP-dependent carboligase